MNLRDRIEQLEPREQKLLAVLVSVFAVMVILIIPVLVAAMVSSSHDDNEQLRAAIDAIHDARDRLDKSAAERAKIDQKYSKKAPALAGYLDKLADDNGIDIPESQDRAPVPHGKKYEERSTKIVMRKVGMLNLAKFMERIENSGYPMRVSGMNLRKKSGEPDSYDVTMTVAAYDRKKSTKKAKKTDDEEGDAQDEEEEEEN